MLRSLKDKLKVSQVLAPAVVTGTVATSGFNVTDFGSLTFAVSVGAFSFTGTDKLSITVQHSDTDSSYVDAADEDIFDAENGAAGIAKVLDAGGDASITHLVHYRGNKKFVRLNIVEAGTVSVGLGVVAIGGHSELMPPL